MSECHCHECEHEHDCGCRHDHEHEHEEKVSVGDWVRLGGALVFGLAAYLVGHPIVSVILWGISYLFAGSHVLLDAGKDIIKGHPFTENLLMAVASIAAFAIGEHLEAVAVLLFYQVGEMLQSKAIGRSRSSIQSLLDIRPDQVDLERDGQIVTVSPDEVKAGDVAVVRAGERVPIDGTVISGETTLDTSALTGESLPRSARTGDAVVGGFVNLTGLIRVCASGTAAESTLARILHIVEDSGKRKAKAQDFITKFAAWYTPAVMIAAVLVAVIPMLIFGFNVDHIYRAAVFLTVSCPCALVISIPIGYFGGIGGASRKGVLFKGSNYLEQMGHVTTVVTDKTGTLTTGDFVVKEIFADHDREEVLCVCAALEQFSNHPLAQAVQKELIEIPYTVTQLKEEAGRGISALLDGEPALAGNAAFLASHDISVPAVDTVDAVIYVAKGGQYLGAVSVGDTIKESALSALAQLRKLGVKRVVMLTGDRPQAAEKTVNALGIDAYRAELLPDQKVAAFEEVAQGVTAFVGDGINDAPVLARADVGVAMGGLGSDAAIEAADVVIMDDDLEKLALAIRASRRTRRIVIGNVILALTVKIAVLLLGTMGWMWLWLAILADTGVALLAVLNSLRALRVE